MSLNAQLACAASTPFHTLPSQINPPTCPLSFVVIFQLFWCKFSSPPPPASPPCARGPSVGTWVRKCQLVHWFNDTNVSEKSIKLPTTFRKVSSVQSPSEKYQVSPSRGNLCVNSPVHRDLLLFVKPARVKTFLSSEQNINIFLCFTFFTE